MAEFAEYYIQFVFSLFTNIGKYFSDRFKPIANIFTGDVKSYIRELSSAAPSFGVVGWIMFILVFIVNTLFIFFLIYKIVQILRRYIFFRAKEVEKDELVEELAKAKDTIAKLTVEKNQLYALKVNAMFPGMGGMIEEKKDKEEKEEISDLPRFPKLVLVDKKYEVSPLYYSIPETEKWGLEKIVECFVNFAASQLQLYYTRETIRYFFAGMATTKVIILEGISGTGKTSLPYAMGKFFSGNSTIVSVQPSWRDRADLLGYLNEFTKTFNETDFLGAVYEASYKKDPSIIILDEMNLARIEYYFAEFLSIMEMPDTSEWLIDVVPSQKENDPVKFIEGKMLVPQSLWFVGTANQDDSTFTITDKVYDRTVTIDLNSRGEYFDAPMTEAVNMPADYLDLLFQQALAKNEISEHNLANLKIIDEFIMDKFKITFGNRIMKQIKVFVPVFVACGGTENEAIDFMLKSKILRKFTALNLSFLRKELNELMTQLDKVFGKGECQKSIDFIKDLIRTL